MSSVIAIHSVYWALVKVCANEEKVRPPHRREARDARRRVAWKSVEEIGYAYGALAQYIDRYNDSLCVHHISSKSPACTTNLYQLSRSITPNKMLSTRALSALVVGFLSSSSLALRTSQFAVPTDLVQRGLAAIGINSNTSDVRNVRISGSQFRTKSIVTTIALDGMDQTVVPYGSQTITYSYETGSLKQRIDKVSGLGSMSSSRYL